MRTNLSLVERAADLDSDVKNLDIEIPESCYECGLSNVNIWGTRTNGRLRVEVKCMRCGKPLSKLENCE